MYRCKLLRMAKIKIIMIHTSNAMRQHDPSFVCGGKESPEISKIHICRVFPVKHHFNRRGKCVSSPSNDLNNSHFLISIKYFQEAVRFSISQISPPKIIYIPCRVNLPTNADPNPSCLLGSFTLSIIHYLWIVLISFL